MSLSKEDLISIRDVVLEALETVVNPRFDRIEAQLDEHTATLAQHGQILADHGAILTEHSHRLTAIENRLTDIEGRLTALENDVKELYGLVPRPGSSDREKRFAKLSPEQKLRQLYADLLTMAQQLHIEL